MRDYVCHSRVGQRQGATNLPEGLGVPKLFGIPYKKEAEKSIQKAISKDIKQDMAKKSC